MRKFIFQTGNYYHIYNRGVDKRDIFIDQKDYLRFLRSMREFNDIEPVGSLYEKYYLKIDPSIGIKRGGVQHSIGCWTPHAPSRQNPQKLLLVEFICYCLNPNHYHFFIRQLIDGGISEFMKRIGGGYTNYFNRKYNRSGSLFEGRYKAIQVKNYSYFLKLAVYINCNSEVHGISSADNWPWSSFFDYIRKRHGTLCNQKPVMQEFRNRNVFQNFCSQVLPDILKIKKIKQYLLE